MHTEERDADDADVMQAKGFSAQDADALALQNLELAEKMDIQSQIMVQMQERVGPFTTGFCDTFAYGLLYFGSTSKSHIILAGLCPMTASCNLTNCQALSACSSWALSRA